MTAGRTRAASLAIAVACALCIPRSSVAADRTVPVFSVTLGVGNSLGWTGLQGEYYLKNGRVSPFLGLGYVIGSGADGNLPTGVAAAAGIRVFSGGRRHRAFFEGSVSEVRREWWVEPSGSIEQAHRYGPGAQVGYQFLKSSGLTFTASAGVGYAVGALSESTGVLFGLTVGHTKWRR
jgi:hypothetical protein